MKDRREYHRQWAAKHKQQRNESHRRWVRNHPEYQEKHKDEERQRKRRWRSEHPEVAKQYAQRLRKEQPEVMKARDALKYAIRKGSLIPQPCEICGHFTTEGHHDDYNEPLKVRWLCKIHHAEFHRKPIPSGHVENINNKQGKVR